MKGEEFSASKSQSFRSHNKKYRSEGHIYPKCVETLPLVEYIYFSGIYLFNKGSCFRGSLAL